MCLVGIAWHAHPDDSVVIAGNRDEYHERATAAADWWTDHPAIFGGRDLVAGGSWLGISRRGRFAVVTNIHGGARPGKAASRGHLVREFLLDDRPPAEFARALEKSAGDYAGFRLVAGTPGDFFVFSGGAGRRAAWRSPRPGLYVVTNAPEDVPWPKGAFLEHAMRSALGGTSVATGQLFSALETRRPVASADHPHMTTPFIVDERFGTRASTVVRIRAGGEVCMTEKRFGPGGAASGNSGIRFHVDVPEAIDRRASRNSRTS